MILSSYYHINPSGELVQGAEWLGTYFRVIGWQEFVDVIYPIAEQQDTKQFAE